MKCPNCESEITHVEVVSTSKQTGKLEGTSIVEYVEKQDRYGWPEGENSYYCPDCGYELTGFVEG